jgi:predicted nucleic acid-binding protein
MTDIERFDRNARSRGLFIDANLLVLLIVGSVNRERIARFKRTSEYTSADWDLLTGLLEHAPRRYATPHVLAEVSTLIDLKGPELETAREILHNAISLMEEVPISSVDACGSIYYRRLGLTDAAIALAAKQQGCSVVTNDSDLYVALLQEGASVVKFDYLREML